MRDARMKCAALATFVWSGPDARPTAVIELAQRTTLKSATTPDKSRNEQTEGIWYLTCDMGGVHGRRRHPRFSVANGDGIFHVLREVSVGHAENGEIVVIDHEPRNANEILTLETFADGAATSTRVRVVASTPVIRNGHVLHELRLMRLIEA